MRPRPILLVDDEPNDLLLARLTIEAAGIRNPIISFPDGEKALAYLGEACGNPALLPGMVFIDVKMPQVEGFEILRWMQQETRLAHVPVAMISSTVHPAERAEARRLGARHYLEKDLSAAKFAEVLADAGVAV